MFERFTDRARRVVVLAREEARGLGHDHVGTEHILLGLIREGDAEAAQVLIGMGADLARTRQEVLRLLGVRVAGPGVTPELRAVGPGRLGQAEARLERIEAKLDAIAAKLGITPDEPGEPG